LRVFGPAGTREWLDIIHSAYPNLEGMEYEVQELKAMDSLSLKGFDIFAEDAQHSITALAYRLEKEEKVVVYSGDTEPSARVAALADGSDLLIHECSFPEPFDVSNHTTPMRLGNMLSNYDLKRVVLTHLYPQTEGHEDEMAQQVIELAGAPTIVGWDMMIIEI
jgi:ribonuclease Z